MELQADGFKSRKGLDLNVKIKKQFGCRRRLRGVYRTVDNHGISAYLGLGTWVMKGHFDTIPRSLEEAAFMDGATTEESFFKIILPLSLPSITFVALNSFITPFMDFILPQIVLRSPEKMTLAQGLYSMVANETNTSFTIFAAGSVLVALPITPL